MVTRLDLDAAAEAALARLVVALRQAATVYEAAWAVTQESIAALGLVDCVLYLVEAEGEYLRQVAAYGPKVAAPGVMESIIRLRIGQGIVGVCAATRVPIRVEDTRGDPRYVLDDARRLSELAVPIVHRRRLLGVLDSEHPEVGFYTAQHERILLQIADLAAERLAELLPAAPPA